MITPGLGVKSIVICHSARPEALSVLEAVL